MPNVVTRMLLRAGEALQGMFDAAGSFGRIRSWFPPSDEINESVFSDGVAMRNRSRKLIVNNPWAASALDVYVANCVGSGPIPRPLHPDKAKRQLIIKLFDRWAKVCTPNRMLDFYGLCAAAVRAERSDGECFTRIRYRRPEDKLPVSIQLQLMEADFCPLDKEDFSKPGGSRIQMGIQFDGISQRVAYHMYMSHPSGRDVNLLETHAVPAEEIVHMFEVRRPGQERGYPWITPAMLSLYDLKQLVDASLMRQKISNLLSIWIRKATGSSGLTGERPAESGKENTFEASFGPGTVNYINSNDEVQFLNPPDAGQNFQAFLASLLRAVARALGLTYEQLTGDLSGVTLASARAGVVEMRRLMEQRQYFILIHQFCQPIWNAWIRQAIFDGALWPEAAAEWSKHPEWFDAQWMPAVFPYVDPVKDLAATKDAIRCGLTSRQEECAKRGVDSEVIDEQNRIDNERADGMGLVYDSDGRTSQATGEQPSLAPEPEPELVGAGGGKKAWQN